MGEPRNRRRSPVRSILLNLAHPDFKCHQGERCGGSPCGFLPGVSQPSLISFARNSSRESDCSGRRGGASSATMQLRWVTCTVSPAAAMANIFAAFVLEDFEAADAHTGKVATRGYFTMSQPRSVPPVAFSTAATRRAENASISASVSVASCGCSATAMASDFLSAGSPLPS